MRFLPRLYTEIIEIAENFGVSIISARSMYEKDMPSNYDSINIFRL